MASQPGVAAGRRYLEALYDSLAGERRGVSDADPLLMLSQLSQAAATAARKAEARPLAFDLLEPLAVVAARRDLEAAVEAARARFETPEGFSECIYLARCLRRDATGALSLLGARQYVAAATVPGSLPDLDTDREAVLNASTFAAAWRDPSRLAWMESILDIWRREYVARYVQFHSRQREALTSLAERLEDAQPLASALGRLNQVRALGPPVGVGALEAYCRLRQARPCPVDERDLAAALGEAPLCPGCGCRLGDSAPASEAGRVVKSLQRALVAQQSRLGSRVVSRILANPRQGDQERIDQFLRVVQASDLDGLILVLDDTLVGFIEDLLSPPAAAGDVLAELAAAFPEVTAETVDAAVAELHRLLLESLSDGRSSRVRLRRP